MTWTKRGHVYVATGEKRWQYSHAYCPTPMALADGRIRVFCAFLDPDRVGRLGWVDVDGADPASVVDVSGEPALDVGEPGTFDDNGVTPLSVLTMPDGRIRLYYAGWQLGVRVRYYLFTGVAESADGGESFQRVRKVPVLDRSDHELHLRSSGHVMPRPEGGYRMWYAAGSEWQKPAGVDKPAYDLRHIESEDGIAWPDLGSVCLERQNADEHGFARPCVLVDDRGYRMWYSLRRFSNGYRVGYAESQDGITWRRRDELAGIDVSASGWDSEMIGLTGLHQTRDGRLYLFYNGNNYGETGFGVAAWGEE